MSLQQMKKELIHIPFTNKTHPESFFEILRLESLLNRKLDHDICKNHIVEFYIILFISAGSGSHTIDFVDYKYKKGTIFLVRKGQIQKFYKNSDVKGYLLIFTEEFIVGHLNKMEASKSFQLFNQLISFPKIQLEAESETFFNFVSLVRQIESEYEYKDEFSIGINRSAMHIVITKLFRMQYMKVPSLGTKKYLAEFLSLQELIEANWSSVKKVQEYADKMGCSSKTLNNIVHTVIHKSAKAFIDEVATTQIKRLLIGSDESIKQIAYSSGFDDPANFFKYFKKNVGISPEAFRKMHQ